MAGNTMNRTKLTLLSIMLAVGTTTFSQDWRQVGDARVDLGPLHEWLAKGRVKGKKEERPLQHWQSIRVLEFKKQLANYDQCTVKLEDGSVTEVLIAHVEPSVWAVYTEIVQIREKAARVQSQIDAANNDLNDANRRTRRNRNSQLKQLRKDIAELNKDEKAALKKLENSKEGGMFAMNTGKTYAGFPVWDCGIKIAVPKQ